VPELLEHADLSGEALFGFDQPLVERLHRDDLALGISGTEDGAHAPAAGDGLDEVPPGDSLPNLHAAIIGEERADRKEPLV